MGAEQYVRAVRREPDPQAVPPHRRGREPGPRDRPLPHGEDGLHAHATRGRLPGAAAAGPRERDTRDPAGARAPRGRCMAVHAR